MPLKLPRPDDERSAPPPRDAKTADAQEPLQLQDIIEYSITMEVSPSRGQKAWIKFGTQSSVRDGETTRQAVRRVHTFVEEELDRRIDALS